MLADTVLDFGGKTYDPRRDRSRLKNALQRVYDLMCDGEWRTLRYIACECNCSEAGASARLRDFRKLKFKARFPRVIDMEAVRLDGGLFAYRLVVKEDGMLF